MAPTRKPRPSWFASRDHFPRISAQIPVARHLEESANPLSPWCPSETHLGRARRRHCGACRRLGGASWRLPGPSLRRGCVWRRRPPQQVSRPPLPPPDNTHRRERDVRQLTATPAIDVRTAGAAVHKGVRRLALVASAAVGADNTTDSTYSPERPNDSVLPAAPDRIQSNTVRVRYSRSGRLQHTVEYVDVGWR